MFLYYLLFLILFVKLLLAIGCLLWKILFEDRLGCSLIAEKLKRWRWDELSLKVTRVNHLVDFLLTSLGPRKRVFGDLNASNNYSWISWNILNSFMNKIKIITNLKRKRIFLFPIFLGICKNPCRRMWCFLKSSSK
jgi:hypothetical protein